MIRSVALSFEHRAANYQRTLQRLFNNPRFNSKSQRFLRLKLWQKSSHILRCRNAAPFRICDMRIGYARVSTDDQTLDLQRDALKRAKCRRIYEEHASGKNTTRPELEACLKSLRTGDTLVVWRLDRLGRSLGNLIQLTNELQSRRIPLETLNRKIHTRSPPGTLGFHLVAAF